MSDVTTTLNKIKEYRPCVHGWQKLLTYLGKTMADDESVSLLTVLESNGVEDAIWAFHASEWQSWMCLYLADVAEHVLPIFGAKHPKDKRPREAIQAIRDFVAGRISRAQLTAAGAAAWAATVDAAVDAERAWQAERLRWYLEREEENRE